MTTWIAGTDVGKSGALALAAQRDGGLVLSGIWTWKQVSRNGLAVWRLGEVVGDVARASTRPTLGHVGEDIAKRVFAVSGSTAIGLYAEATHVRFVTAALSIAGSTGRVLGPIERYADGWEARLVKASVWRADLLKMAIFTKRGAAKAGVAEFVPPLLPGLEEAIARLQRDCRADAFDPEHVYDAGGVTVWGARERTG